MFITGIKTILSKLLFSVKHFCGVCVPASPKHLCVSLYVYFVADFFFLICICITKTQKLQNHSLAPFHKAPQAVKNYQDVKWVRVSILWILIYNKCSHTEYLSLDVDPEEIAKHISV